MITIDSTNKFGGKSSKGFTLVELMLAIAISIFVLGAIYAAYSAQQRTYIVQEQVTAMQQNIRAALYTIVGDIRTAGYDPLSTAGAGITTASAGQISFTQDANGDGDTDDVGEMIDLGFSLADDAGRDGIPDIDADGDGIPDARPLGRQLGGAGGYQAIAENIQAIEFRYLDSAGNATVIINDIRAVQISILARAGEPDPNYLSTAVHDTYVAASGAILWAPVAGVTDNYRRRLLITTVQCRNIGI